MTREYHTIATPTADPATTPAAAVDLPSSPQAYWAGWLSLAFAVTSLILICIGDPLWLGLPGSALAVLAGRYAIRRGQNNHAGAHLGFSLGLFNVMLWLMLIVLMQYVLKLDLTSLFTVPGYD